ncbi:hypothetical protein V5O48_010251 [Marasmius crinis-equi]|uniref:Uncharacterized protein n=1 Tax=Marasmius crinis-equi TaxID=585013 RepID=A0ABR3F9E5_9AGAR
MTPVPVERPPKIPRKRTRKKKKVNVTIDTAKPQAVKQRVQDKPLTKPGRVIQIDFSVIPDNLHGRERKKAREALRDAARNTTRKRGKEVAPPETGVQDVMKDPQITSPVSQGVNASGDERQEICELVQGEHKLPRVRAIPCIE